MKNEKNYLFNNSLYLTIYDEFAYWLLYPKRIISRQLQKYIIWEMASGKVTIRPKELAKHGVIRHVSTIQVMCSLTIRDMVGALPIPQP